MKNKIFISLIGLLVVANVLSITIFWFGKDKHTERQQKQGTGRPADFLIATLKLDDKQQEQLEILRAAHTDSAVIIRKELKGVKEAFFKLIKEPNATDSLKLTAAKNVSAVTEKLDLLALNHFIKVRAICTKEQQKKFDDIIAQVMEMISKAGEPPPHDENRPPRNDDRQGKRPPPIENEK